MDWLPWLEQSTWAVAIRRSSWQYPALEIIHILGIALLVGPAFMFDLRLLGFSKQLPINGLAKHLLPWSQRSLLLVIPSGILLFITNAEALGQDRTFWIKMVLLALAGLNALVFHKFTSLQLTQWNTISTAPAGARMTAVFSIILWTSIITFGRLLPY